MTLMRDFVEVNQQYARSAHVESDLEAWLGGRNGYVLTPLACMSLERILGGLKIGGQRAWSIVGPYGSGKSLFALALAQLFMADSTDLQAELAARAPEVFSLLNRAKSEHGRFVPIFVSCSRGPIGPALRRGIHAAIGISGLDSGVTKPIRDSLDECGPEDSVTICNAVQSISRLPGVGGAIVVIDEFGKALEYMADNRADGDVFVMQMMAEMATRSPKPIIVCTVLHQALDRYFGYLSDVQREELAKVQGRYEEIAFYQPTEQMVRLLAQSMSLKDCGRHRQAILDSFRALALEALDLGLAPLGMSADEFARALTSLAPIHPLTAMVMPNVFSTLAQGERSLFAFLCSDEPDGFQEFLGRQYEPGRPVPTYSLSDLYDYIVSAYGSSLYESRHGRNWAASDSALARIGISNSAEASVIKTIGLINTMGPIAGKGASPDIIAFALGDARLAEEAIMTLEKRSLIVYRSFSDSYALWDGSDIDIESRLGDAAGAVQDVHAIDVVLNELRPPRPMVAHRHSYQKGLLRLFCASYCSVDGLPEHISSPLPEETDGRLVYVICRDPAEAEHLLESPDCLPGADDPLLIVTPVIITSRARAAALQLKRLQWVKENTPALAFDVVASREWRIRLSEAESALASEIVGITTPSAATRVVNYGHTLALGPNGSISSLLSDICDREFRSSPELRNELINRRKLSTQAARARRDLVEAMITHPNEPNLGIAGYPPHLSMYLTILLETGLHSERQGMWGFREVPENSTLAPVWQAWRSFAARSMETRLGLDQFSLEIQRNPYGISNGVLPVLLVAFLLEASDKVAVYESGVYLPYLGVPEAERLIRDASRFEIRYFGACRGHEALYAALGSVGMKSDDSSELLGAIRPICSVAARLVPFARNTAQLPADAVHVRDAVLVAREPDQLLFEQLPLALGLPGVSVWEPECIERSAREYASRLKAAAVTLEGAYDALCDSLYSKIARAFGMDAMDSEVQVHLKDRLTPIASVPMPARAKALFTRLCDVSHSKKEWVESVASLVAGKPPHLWTDQDVSRFDLESLLLRNQLSHILTLASYSDDRVLAGSSDGGWAARVSVTTSRGTELEHVIQIDGVQDKQASDHADKLMSYLDATIGSDDYDMAIAVTARLTEALLARRETLSGEVDHDGRPNQACLGPIRREG